MHVTPCITLNWRTKGRNGNGSQSQKTIHSWYVQDKAQDLNRSHHHIKSVSQVLFKLLSKNCAMGHVHKKGQLSNSLKVVGQMNLKLLGGNGFHIQLLWPTDKTRPVCKTAHSTFSMLCQWEEIQSQKWT